MRWALPELARLVFRLYELDMLEEPEPDFDISVIPRTSGSTEGR